MLHFDFVWLISCKKFWFLWFFMQGYAFILWWVLLCHGRVSVCVCECVLITKTQLPTRNTTDQIATFIFVCPNYRFIIDIYHTKENDVWTSVAQYLGNYWPNGIVSFWEYQIWFYQGFLFFHWGVEHFFPPNKCL